MFNKNLLKLFFTVKNQPKSILSHYINYRRIFIKILIKLIFIIKMEPKSILSYFINYLEMLLKVDFLL